MYPLPPLNPLRAFEAAGRLRSIRRAAAELSVSPSVISRQVQALESYLGVALFIRERAGIRLTARGVSYLAEISTAFTTIAGATGHCMGRRQRNAVRIRAYTTIAMKWLIPRLSSFHAENETTEVFLTTSLEDVNFEREDIDGSIRLGGGNWPSCEADRLLPNIMVPVCSPAYRQRTNLNESSQLVRHTLLHSLARPDDWAFWLEAAGVSVADAHAGRKYESSVLAYQAAIEGHGVAMAQSAFVFEDIAAGRLIQPCGPGIDREAFTYYLVYPRNRLRNPAFREFRAWLLGVVF